MFTCELTQKSWPDKGEGKADLLRFAICVSTETTQKHLTSSSHVFWTAKQSDFHLLPRSTMLDRSICNSADKETSAQSPHHRIIFYPRPRYRITAPDLIAIELPNYIRHYRIIFYDRNAGQRADFARLLSVADFTWIHLGLAIRRC